MIGMFSETAARKFGSRIWQHIDGSEIEVTCVIDDPDNYLWPDKIVVGEVVKYVRQGPPCPNNDKYVVVPKG